MPLTALRAKLEGLGLMPITRRDIFNILVNPFVEKFTLLLSFASEEIGVKEDGSKGMKESEIEDIATAVAVKCIEIACKVNLISYLLYSLTKIEIVFQGKLVKRLCEKFPNIRKVINDVVLSNHQVEIANIPCWEDDMDCGRYRAALSQDFFAWGAEEVHAPESLAPEQQESEPMDLDKNLPSRSGLASSSVVSTEKLAEKEDDLVNIFISHIVME